MHAGDIYEDTVPGIGDGLNKDKDVEKLLRITKFSEADGKM